MRYPEFDALTLMVDLRNPLAACYKTKAGKVFYIEPAFYQALQSLRAIYPDRYPEAIKAVEKIADKNEVTVFAGDWENSLVQLERKAVVLCLTDILDFLGILVEDKSRGSDYGD